jgi:hypothetical protein
MQYFTPLDYARINVGNAYGLDKSLWNHRLLFTLTKSMEELWGLVDQAKDRELYVQSLFILQDIYDGKPTGGLVGLDATFSGK